MVSITFPKADIDALVKQMDRAQTELGKSVKQSVTWAGVGVCKSLAASCRVSPKKRKIYKVTAARLGLTTKGMSKLDRAMVKAGINAAPFGVYLYKNGLPVFTPITKLDRKLIPFTSKTTGEQMARDPKTGEVHRLSSFNLQSKDSVAALSKLIKIWRSGLAKKMWQKASAKMFQGGIVGVGDAEGIAGVKWSGGKSDPLATIYSVLKYAEKALSGGKKDVETAVARATSSLSKKIDMQLAKIAAGGK